MWLPSSLYNDDNSNTIHLFHTLKFISRFVYTLFYKDFIYVFLERGKEGEREEKKYQCVITSCTPPTGDLTCNPSMCPDWELNQRPFGLQAGAQSTEPHEPGLFILFSVPVTNDN